MLETLLIIITKWSPSSYHNWIMMQDEIQKFKFDNNPLVNSKKKKCDMECSNVTNSSTY